jgi:hypothetical protein
MDPNPSTGLSDAEQADLVAALDDATRDGNRRRRRRRRLGRA